MAHIYGSLIACLAAALLPGLAGAIAFADVATGLQIGGVSALIMFLAARPKSWRLF